MSSVIRDMPKETKALTAQDIIDFLSENPDFLSDHPDVLDVLMPPVNIDDKGVADFQSYMIKRLRSDKEVAVETTREIVESVRSNMNNQKRIQEAILRLLEATSLDEFIRCVTMDLSTILDTDISVLVVEANGRDIPHVHHSGIRVLPPGTIEGWMKGKPALLEDNISGIEAIYGGGATLVQSQILLRLDISPETPPALLAFGSRDPNMFQDGQATDQVLYLARVIERCFRSWLNLAV